jgi:hypothetical protein
MTLHDRFEAAHKEYLTFNDIPEADRRHSRPDLCAFIYLHEKLSGDGDMIAGADHDEIRLDYSADDCKKLTDEDILYITRCGVRLGSDGLEMFV